MNVDLNRIGALCRKTIPDVRMAFLGGSQTVEGGKNRVTGSDYDIVVIVGHTKHPHSFNHAPIPHTNATMDIIVRDAETLAFDLDDSRRRGRGAVPNIIANGQVLFDDLGTSTALQNIAHDYVAIGPGKLSEGAYAAGYEDLKDKAKAVATMPTALRSLAAYELSHQAAALHMHHKGLWHASGKLMGRFLMQDMRFKSVLEAQSQYMINTGDVSWIAHILPTPQAAPCASISPLLALAEQETDQQVKDNFAVRYSVETLRDFYKANPDSDIANEFMAAKAFALSQALNPERIGRPSNEYFYALSRVVYNLSEFAEVKGDKKADGNIVNRYDHLVKKFPDIVSDVTQAEQGNPSALQEMVEKFSSKLTYKYNRASMQINPSNFRRPDTTLSTLIL